MGEFSLRVRESTRRRTLELVVERDGSLSLLAPAGTPSAVLEGFVHARREWLYQKTAQKERVYHPPRPKEFVSGEGFFYLGRVYRLKLVDHGPEPLRLHQGRFELLRERSREGRSLFIAWYARQLQPRLQEQAARLAPRLGVRLGTVRVQELGYRWGSCSRSGDLYFHWRSAMLPRSALEYLLVHEMAHLRVPSHQPQFWRLVEQVVPDFEERRSWLVRHGAEYDLG